jgi:dienelactone hydrolase
MISVIRVFTMARRPLPDQGAVVAFPEVGGLHHHYDRVAA